VCEEIGLLEKDYFGLRYSGRKGEKLWMNLRNPLKLQLRGRQPYRLCLQVKYFVHPQELQQPSTRHQYYLTLKSLLLENHFELTEEEQTKCWSLIAQSEYGDKVEDQPVDYQRILPNVSDSHYPAIIEAHRSLNGLTQSYAEIEFLKLVSELDSYGVEFFIVRSEQRQSVTIGVNSTGLQVLPNEKLNETQKIPFEDISRVSYHHNRFVVHYYKRATETDRESSTTCLKYSLPSRRAAQGLFRAFTETHTFFRCERVESVVRQQHSHTGLGSLVALVKPTTCKGKIFQFDVQKTRRQAYDSTWSKLHPHSCSVYTLGSELSLAESIQGASSNSAGSWDLRSGTLERYISQNIAFIKTVDDNIEEESSIMSTDQSKVSTNSDKSETNRTSRTSTHNDLILTLRNEVTQLKESRLCQVCLDNKISTAFCPCGHMMCCVPCAQECKKCPLCRAEITYIQRVFYPCD
ncbi:E3 ubiquitin-protein ligase MYLIP-like, partial [Saccoglossus kowalevskii]|uniref:E3 ubiquitin-protein ligase MYLIP-like n=1 Tax=Saccoglossus kowalevskii TaxID=10224 RepID=A0ABM0LZT1_SACKO